MMHRRHKVSLIVAGVAFLGASAVMAAEMPPAATGASTVAHPKAAASSRVKTTKAPKAYKRKPAAASTRTVTKSEAPNAVTTAPAAAPTPAKPEAPKPATTSETPASKSY